MINSYIGEDWIPEQVRLIAKLDKVSGVTNTIPKKIN